jgi:hypothetical protein
MGEPLAIPIGAAFAQSPEAIAHPNRTVFPVMIPA